jgi:hypothetical protein
MGNMSFFKLYDKLQMEKPYTRVPSPVKYNMLNYMDIITSEPENFTGEHENPRSYALRPIEMNRIAARDEEGWVDMYNRLYSFQDWETKKALAAGQPNLLKPKNLGPEMTDAEFKKWCGMDW